MQPGPLGTQGATSSAPSQIYSSYNYSSQAAAAPSRSATVEEWTPPAGPMEMAPPPGGHYFQRSDMLAFMKNWAEEQGYAIVIGRSRWDRIWLKCDRGGTSQENPKLTPETRKRKRKSTRMVNCPFQVLAHIEKDGTWTCYTANGEHNHGVIEDVAAHPSLRRMNDDQIEKINEMTEADNNPSEILDELRRLWPDIKAIRRDIYNARKKYLSDKEMAEKNAGLHEPQPYEDPNGRWPGPTKTGRWEWLERGDTIKRRARKKVDIVEGIIGEGRERSGDTDVREAATTFRIRRQAHTLGYLPVEPFRPAQPVPAQRPVMRPEDYGPYLPGRNNRRQQNGEMGDFVRDGDEYGNESGIDPSLSLQRQVARDVGVVNGSTTGANGNAVLSNGVPSNAGTGSAPNPATQSSTSTSRAQNGQVLMSRIEQMEKEQRDQKNMLSQILGAVQGMGTRG